MGIHTMSSARSIILCAFANAPGYVRNDDLRIGLGIKQSKRKQNVLQRNIKLDSKAMQIA